MDIAPSPHLPSRRTPGELTDCDDHTQGSCRDRACRFRRPASCRRSSSTGSDRKKTRRVRSTRARPASSALFMSETIDGLNAGAHFLDRLSASEQARVHAAGRTITVPQGEMVFSQGDGHDGIFIIRRGQVRVYCTAPSGREITLAYWTPGHFIGGPEISPAAASTCGPASPSTPARSRRSPARRSRSCLTGMPKLRAGADRRPHRQGQVLLLDGADPRHAIGDRAASPIPVVTCRSCMALPTATPSSSTARSPTTRSPPWSARPGNGSR